MKRKNLFKVILIGGIMAISLVGCNKESNVDSKVDITSTTDSSEDNKKENDNTEIKTNEPSINTTSTTSTTDVTTEPSNKSQSSKTTETTTKKPASNDKKTNESTTSTPTPTSTTTAHTHSYSAADCTHAATCSCGDVKGSPLGHDFGSNNKTCSRCGAANPNYIAPDPNKPSADDWKNDYWVRNNTYETYTSADLVSMGFIPAGTCEGTVIKLYKTDVNSSGMVDYCADISFSGETVPLDFSKSGSIEEKIDSKIFNYLNYGVSTRFCWYSYSYSSGGISVN